MRIRGVAFCAVIAMLFATYYFFQLAPRSISGEVFLQLRSGRVIFASAAEVAAFRRDSERGKKWFDYLYFDEKRRKSREATFNPTDSAELKALKQNYVYGNDLFALANVLSMPASTGGEKSETVCDAKGQFQIRLRPGSYWIVVEGRVGQINGIWSKEIDVPSEQKIEFSESDATFDAGIAE